MIGSTVKVFFFTPYLYTFSSESIWLTISWTNSAWKYVTTHTCKKPNWKNWNRILQNWNRTENRSFFAKPNLKPNRSHFLPTAYPYWKSQLLIGFLHTDWAWSKDLFEQMQDHNKVFYKPFGHCGNFQTYLFECEDWSSSCWQQLITADIIILLLTIIITQYVSVTQP